MDMKKGLHSEAFQVRRTGDMGEMSLRAGRDCSMDTAQSKIERLRRPRAIAGTRWSSHMPKVEQAHMQIESSLDTLLHYLPNLLQTCHSVN